MKGQTQAVTAVLIATVVVGGVATAFIWGSPLLQKSQAEADLSQVQSEAIDLNSKIQDVAESGSNAADTITLNVDTDSDEGRIDVNQEENYIDITTSAENPPYPMDTWTVVDGRGTQNLSIIESGDAGDYGIKGVDTPGVVAVEPIGGAGTSTVTYRVEFRNMLTETPEGDILEKIDIETTEGEVQTGDTEIVITNLGTEQDSGEDSIETSTGEQLDRERTVIRLNMR